MSLEINPLKSFKNPENHPAGEPNRKRKEGLPNNSNIYNI